MKNSKDHLIVALDIETWEEAEDLTQKLGDSVTHYKVGSQLFTAYGPDIVLFLTAQGKKVFLDLKFHDIPNTVANAVSSAVNMATDGGLFMLTLHTLGGHDMMVKAKEAAIKKSEILNAKRPLIVGITVLTSDENTGNTSQLVLERARLAQKAGLDGIVASSQEAALIRREFGKDFIIVTPGIRPRGGDAGDQKRITTPADAISNGSSFLVVGRPIVKAEDPLQAAEDILKEIEQALHKQS